MAICITEIQSTDDTCGASEQNTLWKEENEKIK